MPDTTINDVANTVSNLATSFEKDYTDITNKLNALNSNQVQTQNALGAVQTQQTVANTPTTPDYTPWLIGGIALTLLLFLKK